MMNEGRSCTLFWSEEKNNCPVPVSSVTEEGHAHAHIYKKKIQRKLFLTGEILDKNRPFFSEQTYPEIQLFTHRLPINENSRNDN